MIRPGHVRLITHALLAGMRAVPALVVAVCLVGASLHLAAHHESDSEAHACSICALAQSAQETPAITVAVAPLESGSDPGGQAPKERFASAPAGLLPPERAPPSIPLAS